VTRPTRPTGEGSDPGRDRWRATLRAKAAGAAPERRERFETSSGIEVRDLYTPADTAGLDEDRDLGRPGEYPFTRGVQPTMYRSRFWTMRQYAGFATAEETNRRFRYLLEQGQTGLSVAFDLPTQMGYDSDAPGRTARSAGSASRSARSPTWRCSSTACRSATSRPR
jgi:methylmalonyl-CoA mutase N-terminal domain/subunit